MEESITFHAQSFLWWAGIPIAVVAGVVAACRASFANTLQRFIAGVSLFLGSACFIYLSLWGILMRDGLGPDAISSTGLTAFSRAAPWILFGLAAGVIISGPGIAILTRRARNEGRA